MDEMVAEQIAWNYEQLRKIVSSESSEGDAVKAKLKNVEDIITRELPELIEQVAPPNIYELLGDFHAEYEKFKDFILYESLIGKTIVGLGGQFSSGKSSFLNCLMKGGEILPEAISPSTSVPTYVVHGKKDTVRAINIFDACMELEIAAINEISHGFGAVGEGELVTNAVQLGHVLKNIFLETPRQKYEKLAFLDTPGYSAPNAAEYSEKTDESIARQQLNTVDRILWFLPVDDAGSLRKSDIAFLKTLDQTIPVTIICSKARRRPEEARREIRTRIQEQILLEKLNIAEIFFFDKEAPDSLDGPAIFRLFDQWNGLGYEEEVFAKHFKRLFWECRAFYKKRAEEAGAAIRNLENALLLLEDTEDTRVYIERVKANSEKERVVMGDAEKRMLQIQTEFFKEIKIAADSVGIYMPEPKDIEVLSDKITDPLAILQQYNRDHKTAGSRETKEQLLDMFRDVKPVFDQEPGGSQYQKTVAGILADIHFPRGSEILFGNDINYAELIESTLQHTENENKKRKDKERHV